MSEITKAALLRLWDPATRRCAQCWSPVRLVEQWDGSAALVCPNGCEPGGHVSEIYVRYERMRQDDRAWEAARNYPELAAAAGIYLPNFEEQKAASKALYGDDEDLKAWSRANYPATQQAVAVAPPPRRNWRPRVRAFRPRPGWRPGRHRNERSEACLSED